MLEAFDEGVHFRHERLFEPGRFQTGLLIDADLLLHGGVHKPVPEPHVVSALEFNDHIVGKMGTEDVEELMADETGSPLEDFRAVLKRVVVLVEGRGGNRVSLARPLFQTPKRVRGVPHRSVMGDRLDSQVPAPGSTRNRRLRAIALSGEHRNHLDDGV